MDGDRKRRLAAAFAALRTALVAAALAAFGVPAAAAAELPVLRAAVLQIGTVNWELQTIIRERLDEKHGFRLEVQGMADNGATRVAFAGGAADMMVADWIWVARQRAEGKDYVAIPYSTAVGGVVVPADSPRKSVADLKGARIGIAGGPLDKSWLLLRAYSEKLYGFDLAAETEQVFGAPPLIYKTALRGETDAAVNFWHYMAKMKAEGMREIVSVTDAATALGLDPGTPLLAYVLKGELVAERPALARGLHEASRDAKALLLESDAAWEAIRPMMHAADDAEFEALREGFRAGIPTDRPVDEASAARMYEVMARLGGEELVGKAATMPEGVFADLGE